MKKLLICSGIIIMFFISIVSAVPKIVPYVNDFADVLTPEQELNLNVVLDTIEKNTTYEIAIVTVPDTGGQERVEYANRIGDENGVGKRELSNGIVVLWSLDNEKGGAIGTGRGSESIFNDAKVGRIGRDSEDYFFNESYYEGFQIIITELSKEIENKNNTDIQDDLSSSDFDWWTFLPLLPVGIWLIITLFKSFTESSFYIPSPYMKKRDRKYKKDDEDESSSNSGSYGSFSSGSFGGGSFGGGGAGFGK